MSDVVPFPSRPLAVDKSSAGMLAAEAMRLSAGSNSNPDDGQSEEDYDRAIAMLELASAFVRNWKTANLA
ncbi:hypothetical protein GCM10022280_12590 [Sphingomonas swuensis]|uniref:Uncharacterized protein n=1 Tax=Sphingomonas swuensis TaxID=977800 RepID=A0ABP7SRS6_9SPHN